MKESVKLPSFTFWQRFFRVIILALIVWQLRVDVSNFFMGLLSLVRKQPVSFITFGKSTFTLTGWLFLLVIFYIGYSFWFAQFMFPAISLQDRWKAFWRFFLHGISGGRWHGLAVFVRDGRILGDESEFKKNHPGVAFVDLRSAITLDRHLKDRTDFSPASLENPQKLHFDSRSKSYVAGIRVAGPGLVFTGKNEKITGAVDLRPQSRSRKKVYADTRDGIRVKTDISCSFTVGQPPDILDVCLRGEGTQEVSVIKWDSVHKPQFRKIKSLSRDLHQDDEKEIYSFIMTHPDPSAVHSDVSSSQFPFTFDAKQVEDAIYSKTSNRDPSTVNIYPFKKWSDWPPDVVAEKFRILLAIWPYMNLYAPDDPEKFPLKDFKKELARQVRNTGVLAYRVVALRNNFPIQAEEEYSTSDLIFYPPRNLTRFDVLRYRGIKVLSAGIGDLKPNKEDVREHMKKSWLSSKQREADLKYADYDLEIARIKNQARVRTQHSMIYHLTQLLENQEYPREALAMLIYQELEAAAANPETRRLLPEDTLSLLTGIGTILLANDKGNGKATPGIPMASDGDGNS